MRNKNLLLILFVGIIIALVLAFFATNRQPSQTNQTNNSEAQFIGKFKKDTDPTLSANADIYMEKIENKYCTHIDYGQDEKYIYTWMYCEAKPNEDGIGAAFSIPTRFEYDKTSQSTVNHQQPLDGSMYGPSLKAIFPKEISTENPSRAELDKLESEAKAKLLAETDSKYFEKLKEVTNKYPEYENWETQESFAGKELKHTTVNGIYHFAFITLGSGLPIVEVKCFKVNFDNTINQIEAHQLSGDTYVEDFDPVTCGVSPFRAN